MKYGLFNLNETLDFSANYCGAHTVAQVAIKQH